MHLLQLVPRFQRAARALDTLEARERWSRSDIEAFQLDRLNGVWRRAVAGVPYYRDLSRRHGLPPGFSSLTEFSHCVPPLDRAIVRSHAESLLSESPAPGRWRYTGGSTGAAARVFVEHAAHREALHGRYRHAQSWGVDILDRCVFLWGHNASFSPGWRGRLAKLRRPFEDAARNRLRLSAYDLAPETLSRYLRRIAAFDPASIYAYSTAAYLLGLQALSEGFRGGPSLRYVLLTSERVSPLTVRTVEQAFGVPALTEYGSIECGHLAAEAPDRALHTRDDAVWIETEPRSDGQFAILVTVLNNPSFPLLRYRIGDLTDRPIVRPSHGFARLGPIGGRDNDLVLTRTGRPLHPFWFDDVFENTPGVRRWRIAQDATGVTSVLLEVLPGAPALDIRPLTARMSRQLEGFPVLVSVVDSIPQNQAGKYRWVTSELARPGSVDESNRRTA